MIALYNPQSSAHRRPIIPYSLLALGALLEGRHKYVIVDGNLSHDPVGDICARLGSGGVLGVTVMPGPQMPDALTITREVRARVDSIHTVWGGYFPTLHPEVCLRDSAVDYVIRGHGERPFLKLVETLQDGDRRFGTVTGLGRREPNAAAELTAQRLDEQHVTVTCDPEGPPDPNELPEFPYHRIDMSAYPLATCLGHRTLSHHSSIGCPFTCDYCAVTGMSGGVYRAETPERTARIVTRLVREFGADSIQFYDNNFFVDESRTTETCGRIKPLGIGWWAEGRMDTLLRWSDSTWRLMADSGLKMVFMGAEAASDEGLRRMNRGGNARAADALEMAAKCQELGIIPEFSFVVGTPPDPSRDINDTLAFVRRIKRINPDSEIILYLYTPVPVEGNLYRASLDCGLRFPTTLDEWASEKWVSFVQRRSRVMPWVSRTLYARLRGFEHTLHAYYPTHTDPQLSRWQRALLRAAGAWRYHLRWYRFPIELQVLQRILRYRRPETTGF